MYILLIYKLLIHLKYIVPILILIKYVTYMKCFYDVEVIWLRFRMQIRNN